MQRGGRQPDKRRIYDKEVSWHETYVDLHAILESFTRDTQAKYYDRIHILPKFDVGDELAFVDEEHQNREGQKFGLLLS